MGLAGEAARLGILNDVGSQDFPDAGYGRLMVGNPVKGKIPC